MYLAHFFRGRQMRAYSEAYLEHVVETQGHLFLLVAEKYPDCDTENFINAYMTSKTRRYIDESQAYVNTMDEKEIWDFFLNTDGYQLRKGMSMQGFATDWIGEFYAYYQWYYNISSAKVIELIPVSFLRQAYGGLHDLDLELAVSKVGFASSDV